MPSARELLEQADALMRRNRSPLMDDIPVLTDSVPEARQGVPARLRPARPQPKAPDKIPMLTEREASAPAQPPAVPATPAAPARTAAVVDEGEPSDWLQLGGGEPSVIGEAPDSIAIVPAVEDEVSEEIEVEAPPEVEEAFDAELTERVRPVVRTVPEVSPLDGIPELQVTPVPAEAFPWEADTIIDEPEQQLPPIETEPEVHAAAPPAVESTPMEAPVEARQSAAERQADEDARWAAMAEEIRMQVLQRIDLFTDAGLRDQLGTRLQPIVDRASADLVATINQHVGELLRAYVSEAIEREIENWRHAQRP